MDRTGIDLLRISELKWTGLGHFMSDEHRIFYSGNEKIRRHGVGFICNKKISKSIWGYNPFNARMISIRIQAKPINITIIQIYSPTTAATDEEIEEFYAKLQELKDNKTKKDICITMGAKIGAERTIGITGEAGTRTRQPKWSRKKNDEFCQENENIIANTFFTQPKRRLYTWTSPDGQYRNQIDNIIIARRWKSCITAVHTLPGAHSAGTITNS